MADNSEQRFTSEDRASLDRFAYIYIACEGAMILMVFCFLLIGYCIYRWRSRNGFFHHQPDKLKPQLLSNVTDTALEDFEDLGETVFFRESFLS